MDFHHKSSGDHILFGGSKSGRDKTGRQTVRLVMLGGTGNVTKNMFVYELRNDGRLTDILIVDCGVGFPEPDMYGVDLIIPDVGYLDDKKNKIRGVVFTHGHDDHIGGIAYIYPKLGNIPMYGTPLTAAFANVKLKEAKISARVKTCQFSDFLNLGPFNVSFIRMTHSVPDAANLVISTPVGIFYHGSDFKFDQTPLDGKVSEMDKIIAAGKRGILCLLTDCLGSERRGFTPSEQVIGETLKREIGHCPGKFIFTTQSSNISRIDLAVKIAFAHGRKIAFLGRSIGQNVDEARNLGYISFSQDQVVRDRDLRKTPDNKICLIVAGAQGQQNSALHRIAHDNHAFVKIGPGDTVVISADPIPGNEYDVGLLLEQLFRKEVRVAYSDVTEDLHVSGHGSQGDMMRLLTAVGPSYIIPIGGTYRHIMQYRQLAADVGYPKNTVLVPEEGEILEFSTWNAPRVADTVELENIMVDGLGVGDVKSVVLRDRRTIATEGIVVIVVPIDEATGRVTAEPDVISRGFVYMKESEALIGMVKRKVLESLRLKKGRIINWHFVRKRIEEEIGKFLLKKTGRSPLVVPVIVEV
jgi:ribonuclease J